MWITFTSESLDEVKLNLNKVVLIRFQSDLILLGLSVGQVIKIKREHN